MGSLLSFKFWFNFRPGSLSPSAMQYFFFFLVFLTVLVFISALIKSNYKKSLYVRLWRKLYSFGLTNLIVGLFLLFFTYEMAWFLSARFWFIFWGLSMLTWLFFILKEVVKIPKIKEEIAKEREYKKYLPDKKG